MTENGLDTEAWHVTPYSVVRGSSVLLVGYVSDPTIIKRVTPSFRSALLLVMAC
jgi:hypothetical protein